MIFIRKVLSWIIIVFFLLIIQWVSAQTTTLCSKTNRWWLSTNLETYQSLYNPSDLLKQYFVAANIAIDWNNTKISWMTKRNDNKKGWCNNWSFIGDELSLWNTFWQKHATLAWVSNNWDLSIATVTTMQNYIQDTCGLDMWVDWLLWKKTVNAPKLCQKLPCQWDCKWSWFEDNKEKLYFDLQWTQIVYKSNQFQWDPSQKLYFKQSDFPSKQISPWLWLVQTGSITNGTSAVAGTSSIADTNSTTTCRFQPQAGVTPSTEYTTAVNNTNEYIVPTDACTNWCWNGYTEVKKWWIAICEKCDLKKCNCGIKLNTNIPFIGRCIMNQQTNNVWQSGDVMTVNSLNAFPILMWALIKLLMSIIMIVCFASLIVWWFMMTVPDQYETGKWIVKKVIRTIVALWSLGTILYLINPNFFF